MNNNEAIANLLMRLNLYLDGKISLDIVKADIWNAAQEMTSVHDRHYRELLQSAEANLDSMCFSVDNATLGLKALGYVSNLRDVLTESLNNGD